MLPLGEAGYALHLGAKAFKVTIYVRVKRYYYLAKEYRGDGEGSDDSGEIGNQAAGNGVAGVFDIDRAEIDS